MNVKSQPRTDDTTISTGNSVVVGQDGSASASDRCGRSADSDGHRGALLLADIDRRLQDPETL